MRNLLLFCAGNITLVVGHATHEIVKPQEGDPLMYVIGISSVLGVGLAVVTLFLMLCRVVPWFESVRAWYCFHVRRFFGVYEFKSRWAWHDRNLSDRDYWRHTWSTIVMLLSTKVFFLALLSYYLAFAVVTHQLGGPNMLTKE